MGMFDRIQIEDKINLPLPENFNCKISDLEFQTKSLDNSLSLYTIANDKHLYCEESFSENPTKEKVNFHGVIDFGAYYQTDLIDYSIDYEAKFTDGILQSIELTGFKSYNHEPREKLFEKLKKEKDKPTRKFLIFLQNILIGYPLKIFGVNLSSVGPGVLSGENRTLYFYFPSIAIGYKKQLRGETYGLSVQRIDTEICFLKTIAAKQFYFKILGIGFSISFFEDWMVDSYS